MAVNVSTVDNTTRACVDARADGHDGGRLGSSAAVGLEVGSEPELEPGLESGPDPGVEVGDADFAAGRPAALERDRAVDGVDPAARIGNRSRRPAMITALSTSTPRQDRPRPATGVADTGDTETDGINELATHSEGSPMPSATGPIALRRPSHSSDR
ncbi:hypothetical protein [Halopiger xanaduensis]|uniref:Uncharacterized protein n=1 Tax=Halopiger xanaduensis (strain DSM 18323 / JCM 14033 / SH-6) TaxID=797210 RepID=F8D9N0_HALXS|nr:hypothetical protein [Halopiger xanaduensis]AEH38124.1 hypothetical protein Halxa_3513 [Halopiger xanaduensis SH-6]